ncbi:MAG: hypothetical protein RLZZ455_267 [Candidatus Parcubacteria bacterium]|jgi:hypothetical protein
MNKKLLFPALAVVFVLLVGAGGYFFLSRNSSGSPSEQEEQGFVDEVIPTMAPDAIGLSMVARSDKKAVKLVLSNASDIQSIEFDLVYDADQSTSFGEDDGGSGQVSRNVTDEVAVDGESPFETKYYDLGSCSSGKCRYDTGVTEVKLEMKVTKKDGKVFQVSDSLDL